MVHCYLGPSVIRSPCLADFHPIKVPGFLPSLRVVFSVFSVSLFLVGSSWVSDWLSGLSGSSGGWNESRGIQDRLQRALWAFASAPEPAHSCG